MRMRGLGIFAAAAAFFGIGRAPELASDRMVTCTTATFDGSTHHHSFPKREKKRSGGGFGGSKRYGQRYYRKRTLFSSRLGPGDRRPVVGNRWTPWKREHYGLVRVCGTHVLAMPEACR